MKLLKRIYNFVSMPVLGVGVSLEFLFIQTFAHQINPLYMNYLHHCINIVIWLFALVLSINNADKFGWYDEKMEKS